MSNTNTFIQFLNELKTLESRIAEREAEREAIRDLIKEELTAADLEELSIGNYKLTYRTTISNRFDSTAFKKSHSDLYKAFTKQTSYKRLTIN